MAILIWRISRMKESQAGAIFRKESIFRSSLHAGSSKMADECTMVKLNPTDLFQNISLEENVQKY